MPDCRRGEVWKGNLDPVQGHEQAGTRPLLIVSDELFNRSRAELVIVVPITTKSKRVMHHVEVQPPEGGLRHRSFIKCEDIRSTDVHRLAERMGEVSDATMAAVERRLRRLLRLR